MSTTKSTDQNAGTGSDEDANLGDGEDIVLDSEDHAYREDDDYMLHDHEEGEEGEEGDAEDYPFHDGDDDDDDDLLDDGISFSAPDPETEALWTEIGELAASDEDAALAKAVEKDLDDENRLTNEIFFARHPELGRRKLRRDERTLTREWVKIRNKQVRPALRAGKKAKAAATKQAADSPQQAKVEATLLQGLRSDSDEQPIRLRKVRKGYSAYVGERVQVALTDLKAQGRIDTSDDDIEMLQRMANVETKGLINAVNSWDSVFMSAGFMQWPVLFKDPVGKLQRWIQRAPEAFAKYGIELDKDRKWKIPVGKYTYTSAAIVGADSWNDLRERKWAERFYRAGLDSDAVAAEAVLAIEVTDSAKKRIVRKCGDAFVPFYDRSVSLRALVQETFNHRPAWLYRAMKLAIKEAAKLELPEDKPEDFLPGLHRGIRTIYQAKNKARSAENLIKKTGRVVL